MKKTFSAFFLIVVFCFTGYTQDSAETWDIDSIFDGPPVIDIPDEPDGAISLRDRITLEAAYSFLGGFFPGWYEVPWYKGEKEYDYIIGARLEAILSIDLPLTDNFRVYNAFYFSVPDSAIFSIKEFYFDYNFKQVAFLRAGLYEINWGISRFYPFTNLPALVPQDPLTWGDAYTGRLIIPIGIGGFEFLAMTRIGYLSNVTSPQFNELAYGLKYNLALQRADIDTGFLYHKDLPFRYFVSLKTTLGNTELYTEGLIAVSQEKEHEVYYSGNAGIIQDFFKGNLTLMAEAFYNGEPSSAWWRPRTTLLEEDKVDLYQGFNAAFAFIIRPGVLGMRIFAQALYTYEQNSVWLVPGISIKPGGITISLSTPMALGSRRDIGNKTNYYRSNTDQRNRPFSIILGISYSGKYRYTL